MLLSFFKIGENAPGILSIRIEKLFLDAMRNEFSVIHEATPTMEKTNKESWTARSPKNYQAL